MLNHPGSSSSLTVGSFLISGSGVGDRVGKSAEWHA